MPTSRGTDGNTDRRARLRGHAGVLCRARILQSVAGALIVRGLADSAQGFLDPGPSEGRRPPALQPCP